VSAAGRSPRARWQQRLPLQLTYGRLALVPVLGLLLAALPDAGDAAALRSWAAGVFVLGSVTDLLDGALARRWDATSRAGEILDPIADKALVAVALIGLSAQGLLPWWVTVIILARELAVTILRFAGSDPRALLSSRWGKAKTVVQMVAITAVLLPLGGFLGVMAEVTMGAAVILTVVTGADYVVRAVASRR